VGVECVDGGEELSLRKVEKAEIIFSEETFVGPLKQANDTQDLVALATLLLGES